MASSDWIETRQTIGPKRWKFLGLLQYVRHYPMFSLTFKDRCAVFGSLNCLFMRNRLASSYRTTVN